MDKKNQNAVYTQGYIWKKEGVNNWVNYLGVIRGQWFLFYDDPEGEKRGQLRKTLELPDGTKCSLAPRRKKRFPFSINNGHAVYYVKCETELQRHQWIFCILLSSTNKLPQALPKSVPKQLAESTMFPKMAKYEKKLEYSNKKRQGKLVEDSNKSESVTNKRRQKYVKRIETKIRTKADTDGEDDSDDDEYGKDIPTTARSLDVHDKTRRNHETQVLETGFDSRRRSTGDIRTRAIGQEVNPKSVTVSAQIHAPVEILPQSNKSTRTNDVPLVSISEADGEMNMSCLVIANDNFNDNLLLPNMIIEDLENDDISNNFSNNSRDKNTMTTDITGRSNRISNTKKSNSASLNDLESFSPTGMKDYSSRPNSAKTYKELSSKNSIVREESNLLPRNTNFNRSSTPNLIYLSPQLPRKTDNSPSTRKTYSRHLSSNSEA